MGAVRLTCPFRTGSGCSTSTPGGAGTRPSVPTGTTCRKPSISGRGRSGLPTTRRFLVTFFGGRMLVRQLPEYLKSMRALAEEFRGVIRVIPGLETEYLPGMDEWYGELKDAGLVLLLGQHMYACPDGTMNFRLPEVRRRAEEADGIADALAAGIASGHFFAAAHPDRAFRHRPVWTKEEDRLSRIILKAAREARIPVEDNLACHRSGQFRPEFWQMAGEYGARTVCGLDAHSPEEVVRWTGTEYSERKKETI